MGPLDPGRRHQAGVAFVYAVEAAVLLARSQFATTVTTMMSHGPLIENGSIVLYRQQITAGADENLHQRDDPYGPRRPVSRRAEALKPREGEDEDGHQGKIERPPAV